MGSLFDELKKAKLIDKKKEKQLRHEQRTHKKSSKDRDAEGEAKRREHEKRRKQQRKKDRQRSEREKAAKERRARWAELKQLIASRQLARENGRRRWYFVAPNGCIPYFEVSESTGRRLEAGELAIVRDPNEEWTSYQIVPRDIGTRMKELEPDHVCYLK